MRKEQKNQKLQVGRLKALNNAQLLSIKGGAEEEEPEAVVLDNGCGCGKGG